MKFIKILCLSVGFLSSSYSFASDLSNCEQDSANLLSSYNNTLKAAKGLPNNLSKYEWLDQSTVKSVTDGLIIESDNLAKMYYVATELKNRGEFIRCSYVSQQSLQIGSKLNILIASIPNVTANSQLQQAELKKESKCTKQEQCFKYYDLWSQYQISVLLKNYQDQVVPIFKNIVITTEK